LFIAGVECFGKSPSNNDMNVNGLCDDTAEMRFSLLEKYIGSPKETFLDFLVT
jgi:hypothetical protein